jgi:hypothetical protein
MIEVPYIQCYVCSFHDKSVESLRGVTCFKMFPLETGRMIVILESCRASANYTLAHDLIHVCSIEVD